MAALNSEEKRRGAVADELPRLVIQLAISIIIDVILESRLMQTSTVNGVPSVTPVNY
jgi:hypothetical protein